jgi:hypothetical protein
MQQGLGAASSRTIGQALPGGPPHLAVGANGGSGAVAAPGKSGAIHADLNISVD